MNRQQCPVCGAMRSVSDGVAFPAHPDTRQYPRFIWCAFGDMSSAVVGVFS